MTKKRRRPDTPLRSVPTVPVPLLNGNSETSASLQAAIRRAILGEDEISDSELAIAGHSPTTPQPPPRTLKLHVPPGVSTEMANAQMRIRGLVHNALLIEDYSAPLYGAVEDLTATAPRAARLCSSSFSSSYPPRCPSWIRSSSHRSLRSRRFASTGSAYGRCQQFC